MHMIMESSLLHLGYSGVFLNTIIYRIQTNSKILSATTRKSRSIAKNEFLATEDIPSIDDGKLDMIYVCQSIQ
jgi:hypothetical protein